MLFNISTVFFDISLFMGRQEALLLHFLILILYLYEMKYHLE